MFLSLLGEFGLAYKTNLFSQYELPIAIGVKTFNGLLLINIIFLIIETLLAIQHTD